MGSLRQFFPSPTSSPVLPLSAEDLARALPPEVCFEALLQAYRDLADDLGCVPKTLGFHAGAGTYHIKAGLYPKARDVFAAKLNANFPGNFRDGLPTIQGLVLLSDAAPGTPLAVMDSGELTARRTAALAAHLLEAGIITEDDVRADLCDPASGRTSARNSDREIVLFDSTGTGLQDVAAAKSACQAALKSGRT